jgi:hypothetical protein
LKLQGKIFIIVLHNQITSQEALNGITKEVSDMLQTAA